MESNKLNHEDALGFIFAGNSLFTVLNTQTGNRFTFKVKKAKTDGDVSIHFVKVLVNPEVYSFIGTCFDMQYRHSNKSSISVGAQSVKVFNYIIDKLISETLPEYIEIWHEGRCGKCGRTLTVPSSIKIGIGPECLKSMVNIKNIKRAIRLDLILN